MALHLSSSWIFMTFALILIILPKPTHAFGAGNIPENTESDLWVWKHGDIGEVLRYLPVSFITKYGFTKLEIMQVYFGNWLRDYSQAIDITLLRKMNERTLRTIVSILGFMEFGLTTDEFNVSYDRLGCYRPEEHIDNPKGYAPSTPDDQLSPDDGLLPSGKIREFDSRLRGKVEKKEYEIDPKTGMKNYIANETIDINTSAGYIRTQLKECIEKGRSGRNGNKRDMQDAFIHLGALLHTLEDFSAHSNYVELVLQAIGETDIFAFVGGKCRVKIPDTEQEVPPVVTGTFGSLDVFQSIIGEVDDRVSMRSKGLIGLESNLGVGSIERFKRLAAPISHALDFLELLPDAGDIRKDFRKVMDAVNIFGDKKPVDASGVTGGLWEMVEPLFSFHGTVKRFWIENKDKLDLPLIKTAIDQIGNSIDDLTYAALAIITESAVNAAREAIKEGKETLEKLDRESSKGENIFNKDSDSSDPSHSILAKDHFSNYLNPIAGESGESPSANDRGSKCQPTARSGSLTFLLGRVATATTNWTTQRVVECWDSDDVNEIEARINSILEILHHPSFARAKTPTFIQKTMFNIVEEWWRGRSDHQKEVLRAALCKKGIEANGDEHINGDNNPATETKSISGAYGYAIDWCGATPEIKEKEEEKTLGHEIINIVNKVVGAFDSATKDLVDGVKDAADMIKDGLGAAAEATKDVAEEMGNGLKRGFEEFVEGSEELAEGLERDVKKVYDETTRVGQQVLDGTTQAVGEAVEAVDHAAEDVVNKGAEIVQDVGNTIENGANQVAETGDQVVREVGNFVDNSARAADEFVADVGNKVGNVANDMANSLERGISSIFSW